MFSRIAIVNRGEAAMRLIHAVRDLSAETGTRIETVALYTSADRTAMFVREADLAYPLGLASARPYLDYAVLESALVETGADAAWVGWGFVAEDPAFAGLCEKIGVTFIGPDAEAMRRLGDKIGAKLIAQEVGVPVAPWSGGEVATLDDALAAAARIGYPLMLKAAAGGGGRGIRVITSDGDLTDTFERTRQEALRAFGSGTVFLERLITGARHVEVQLIADGQGTAWALGVRDCSVQRRNQKVIEESASPVLAPEQAAELKVSAERLALTVGYRGAATVEFLYHPGERQFAFLEVNTRLQVEHPITEMVTGVDLVRLQLHVAAGGKLEEPKPAESGHAVEARLNAEDPDRDFAPAPGRIARLVLPAGPGVRVDTGVSEGDIIPADFDSMIAKIIAYGSDRDQALGRLRRALGETTVVIEGGAANKSFLLDLLDQPEVINASVDTGWIDRARAEGRLAAHRHAAVALAAAGIEAYQDEEDVSRQRLLATAHGGRPQVQHDSGRPLDLKLRGASYRVRVARLGPDRFRVGVSAGADVHQADIEVERFDEHSGRLVVNGRRFRLTTATHGPIHLIEIDSVTHRISLDEGGVVRSPAPALVVATPLSVGDEVAENAPVLVLESMKMETVLRAPFRGHVRECLVSVGSQVEAGAPLLRLDPVATEDAGQDTPAASKAAEIDLPTSMSDVPAAEQVERLREDLRGLLLGFDGDAADRKRLLAGYLAARAELGGQPVPGEPELLTVFADLSELSRNRQGSDLEVEPGSAVHSPGEYFHSYLQTLDVERAGITEGFQARLKRMLAHYDVTSLDRSPQLETAVFRIFLAQQRMTGNVEIVSGLLRQWLVSAPPAEPLRERAGLTLEHLIEATQVRFPAVSDLARGVIFRWFAQPLLRRNRAMVYATVRNDLRYLDSNPNAPDRARRIQAMVASSEPLVRLIGQRIGRGVDHAPLLEVLTRRYYSNRRLADVMARDVAGVRFVTAEYSGTDTTTPLAATATSAAGLPGAIAGIAELASQAPAGGLVADLYVTWAEQPDPDALAARIRDLLTESPLAATMAQITRITVTVVGTGGTAVQHHFTFRPDGARLTEDRLIRGLHPQVAERLQLDRLRAFDLTRLPSADEEIYLFKAVAKTNPADERLIAMGQVRDLTPLRDADGRLVALPELENVLAGCLDAIRIVQAQRPQHRRFASNRIMMYVWPASEFTVGELAPLARRIRPGVSGSGVEEVQFVARLRGATGESAEMAVRVSDDARGQVQIDVGPPPTEPLLPLDDYQQKVLRATRRGNAYPYQLTDLMAGPGGRFTEHDLNDIGALVPVGRPKGMNRAAIVAGVVSTPTKKHPGGVTRVVLLGDPTKSLGALSEPECARVIAAIDLAERMAVPLEWFSLSSGARISMESGTENMDWVAAALKRIVEFTQAG
ncbi:MAG TPA: biotin carboxylase N-terminal domain-containing protein, partial [Streptosporangiaceae bacterium]|nr:biotin carboxylase N-terminal domain-containing protein [Streptosporangiaceae bacterium]